MSPGISLALNEENPLEAIRAGCERMPPPTPIFGFAPEGVDVAGAGASSPEYLNLWKGQTEEFVLIESVFSIHRRVRMSAEFVLLRRIVLELTSAQLLLRGK